MVGCSYFFEIAFWKFVGDPQLNVTKYVYLIDAEHFSTLNLLWLEYRNTLYMSVKPGISSFEWYHQKCADCMFVPLFYANRSPNPIVKTALLQTTSTKSTSREWGDNNTECNTLIIQDAFNVSYTWCITNTVLQL